MMDYDSALEMVGGCGRYQILIFFLVGVIIMKCGIDMQLLVFTTYAPAYSCVEPYNSTNSTKTACQEKDDSNETCTSWSYDKTLVDSTMTTEFNLICDKEYLQPLFMTLVLIAILIGRDIGTLGDKLGRRKIFLILVGYDLILSPIQAFVPTLEAQFVTRILRGFGDGVLFTAPPYILELVGVKYRVFFGSNYWVFYCVGYASTALLGNYLRNWRYMIAASCFILPSYILLCFFLYESPRWLLVKGRRKEAIKVLIKIGQINRKQNVDFHQLETVRVEENVRTGSIIDCFSSRTMAMKTIIMTVVMWCGNVAYFGITLDGSIASKNIFINMALMGLIEIPTSPLAWVLGDKLGRKYPSIVLFLLSGVLILIIPHLPAEGSASWVKAMIAVSGKLALNTGYIVMYIYVAELQPTCIRNVSLLPALTVASLGGILAPLVIYQATVAYWIPSVIFGTWCFVGGLVMIPLPETRNLPLTQTVEEADLLVLGQEHRFIDRLHKLRAQDTDEVLLDEMSPKEMLENVVA